MSSLIADNTLLSTREASEVAGVAAVTIHAWKRTGKITPAHRDEDGRYHYRLTDVLRVERETRSSGKGRPRKATITARCLAVIDWPLSDVEHYLSAAGEAMCGMEDARGFIRHALGRLGYRGYPEGVLVTDLRRWVDSAGTPERLRGRILDLAIVELAERQAGALRSRRPPLDPDGEPALAS